jgi:hypothetical protein
MRLAAQQFLTATNLPAAGRRKEPAAAGATLQTCLSTVMYPIHRIIDFSNQQINKSTNKQINE